MYNALFYRSVLLEIRRIRVDERTQVDAPALVDPDARHREARLPPRFRRGRRRGRGRGLARLVVVVAVEELVLFHVESLKNEARII